MKSEEGGYQGGIATTVAINLSWALLHVAVVIDGCDFCPSQNLW